MEINEVLETLDGKVEGETLETIKKSFNDLIEARDKARNESIDKRKTMQAKLAAYESERAQLLEKLGIESLEDLEAIPGNAKGAAESAKQAEARLKRLEREHSEALKTIEAMQENDRKKTTQLAINEAVAGFDWIANDVPVSLIRDRVAWEDGEVLYRQDDGGLIPLKDGVSVLAKSRPELLKASGTGGAGVRKAGRPDGQQTMTRAEFDALSQGKRGEFFKNGGKLVEH